MTTRREADDGLRGAQVETRIVFVSHAPDAGEELSRGRFGPDIAVVDFSTLDAALLDRFDPHFVVSPILTSGFDILDVAERLWQLRFGGAYRVLTEAQLPNPDLVLREVRLKCPGLDVDILCTETLRG